ncbi:potassium channel family protein [Streptomyces sp. NBC_01218]|uniref:potassium channel family protein n=1 Tax=unclassified Streptomyces TaxID=2593676 RepID=UPI0023B8AB50|nr:MULTISPECIES: potassium channel family protein [unclassified Streptomyces]WEH42798.1 potassium channel family protein [Streptomyces sp. AM 2-1-1]WSQ54434.1 potassium channel family protein [Streptomyces sp. NBC_01218]
MSDRPVPPSDRPDPPNGRPAVLVPPGLRRWEARTEIPLGIASLVFLAGYALHVLAGRDRPPWPDVGLVLVYGTWALFVVDYGVRLRLSGQGHRFVRSHGLDTVVLVMPLLRPLRVVKVYAAVQQRRARPRLSLYARVMSYAGLSALLLGLSAALTVYHVEHTAPGAGIRTFGDAVWWACETLTTVGYGDVVPVTPEGRVVAAGLMACGLALLGAVTGSFSSWLLQVFRREDEEGPPAG